MVFVPPLIGGDATQQVRMFRQLLRQGMDLISFNYAGHGRTMGRFSLRAACLNCTCILDLALHHCQQTQMPLFGLAASYAAVPLLQAARIRCEPMHKLVLINPIPRWPLGKISAHFWQFWRQGEDWQYRSRYMLEALRAYRDDLLPGVSHRRHAFGVLARHRVKWLRLIWELLLQAPVPPAAVKQTPVMCIYGRKDRLLQQLGYCNWQQYEMLMRSLCPQTRFLPLNSGHFILRPDVRSHLLKNVLYFFNLQEQPKAADESHHNLVR